MPPYTKPVLAPKFASVVLIKYGEATLYTIPKVEYAVKAVENGGTASGIRCKDGVVLALEKIVTSKLLKKGANKRIATVDRNMGIVRCPASASTRGRKLTTPSTGLIGSCP